MPDAGRTVSVHYHGTLDNGDVFDSSRGGDPLTFVVGRGEVIEGFDRAVLGLAAVGQSVTLRLEPAQAYGERRDDLLLEFRRELVPAEIAVGAHVALSGGVSAVVIEVTDAVVRVDANHALAGQALTFEIELVAVR